LASLEMTPVVPIQIVSLSPRALPAAEENIISRHWHESGAPVRLSNVASSRKVKNINAKSRIVPAKLTEVTCSKDSSRTLLQTQNRSSRCRSGSTLPVKRTVTAK
jgi:hypothetical protein